VDRSSDEDIGTVTRLTVRAKILWTLLNGPGSSGFFSPRK
jgi:hypothetical protein